MQRQPSGRLICPDGCLFFGNLWIPSSCLKLDITNWINKTILEIQINNFVLFMQKFYRNR